MIEPTTLDGESVTVVGGGVAGLASAAYLANGGADVTVLERHDTLGGVTNRFERDGFTFDTGPSWYLMPETFERFFSHFDRSRAAYFSLERLDPQYRVFFKDGDAVEIKPDLEAIKALFESYEAGGAAALESYLAEARRTYEVGMEHFVYEDRARFRDLVDPSIVHALPALSHLGSMQEYVAEYFESPKLQQLLQYQLVFLGSSPHEAPSLYNLMAHVDFEQGVYYPEDGMYSLVEALVDLGSELGVTYRTGTDVTALEPLKDGLAVEHSRGTHVADSVVANANPAHVEQDLLPEGVGREESTWNSLTYGPSAFMLFLGVEGDVEPLAHHSLVFPTDWDPHFERIFDDPGWPEDPAYYLSVASKTDDAVAPEGHHAVVVLVPIAPGLADDPERVESFRESVLKDLAAEPGVDLRDRIVVEESMCVSEFADQYRTPGGAALGLAHTLGQTGPFRPSHHAPDVEGLYYAGDFTSPGVGLPMALISGEHAADAVARDAGTTPFNDLFPNL